MKWLFALCVAVLGMQQCVAPPVVQNKETADTKEEYHPDANALEYDRYLQEIIETLGSDDGFRAKLNNLSNKDISNTNIAHELNYVHPDVRTKLDEIKRVELLRLRQLANKMYEITNAIDTDHLKIPEHVDHTNPNTFEVADLKKLILKATADLAEKDRKRRENFKEYEMEKKYEQEEKMKKMDEEHKKKFEEELNNMKIKHKDHEPLHHPGSKQQLEEVWEQQDHMSPEDFDPRAFFYLHDLDGNHYWDQSEVKALFVKELDKMYSNGTPEDDLRERAEELERMREHVFNETDVNQDGLISFEEFMAQTKNPDFNKDEGWNTVDELPVYTQEDYEHFSRERDHEYQQMLARGNYPPEHVNIPVNHIGHPEQQQFHGQVPPEQQFHGQVPPQQQFHGQVPAQQQFHGQVPSQQQFHGQVPPQQQFHGQVPPQQQFHGQVPPQQQLHGQVPYQQQFPGQVPHQQQFPGQVPHQQQFQGQVQSPQQLQGQVQSPQHHLDQISSQYVQQQQYQGQQQIPQYQAHPAQNQPPPQQQYGQVPVQRQAAVPASQQAAIPVQQQQQQQQQQAAVPVQQNTQSQASIQGQVPVQQTNIPAQNNQAQQQAGQNQVPVLEKSAQAPTPNVVSV